MLQSLSLHRRAVLQALLVTLLWSTSWVLIKLGLGEIPALTFAGLRYTLAWLCLLPFILHPKRLTILRRLTLTAWLRLIVLGLLFYSVAQGAQFLGLAYLPAVTVSLLLNLTTIVVALMGVALLAERPTGVQWIGVGLAGLGALLYFYPVALGANQMLGLLIVLVGVGANAASAVFGRQINRAANLSPLVVTVISMGVGALSLLAVGLAGQGLPHLSMSHWILIGWLAIVNTAFAFTLWNYTLRTLSAVESSMINNSMLVQIALLAWLFLGETPTLKEIAGLLVTLVGIWLVQRR